MAVTAHCSDQAGTANPEIKFLLNMQKIYTRQLTTNERTFLMADAICPPFVNQYVLEGEGELDKGRWQKAVDEASAANPGMRVALTGVLGFSKWVDSGNAPPVREVDGSAWGGFGPEGGSFLYDCLDARKGPTAEVVLIHGKRPRVLFRSLHATADGRGQLYWMKDIFRALNGKPLSGSLSTLTEYQVAKRFNMGFRKKYPDEHIPPTGRVIGNEPGVVWKRVQLTGKYPKILPQLCILLAKEAWKHANGVVRFGIPADMRLHDRKLKSTANLTCGVVLEVRPDTTPDDVEKEILRQLQEKEDLKLYRGEDLFRYVPMWLMKREYYKLMDKRHKKGLYNITAYLSNMGYVQMGPFQGGGFKATSFFPITPYAEPLPCFIGLASHGNEENGFFQEIVLTMPKIFASNGRFDTLLDRLQHGLEEFVKA